MTSDGAAVRLARVAGDDGPFIGIVDDGHVAEIDLTWAAALAALAAGRAGDLRAAQTGRREVLDHDALLAPLELGSEVYCVGLNYSAHAHEAAELVDEVRPVPIIFGKTHRSMTRPSAPLALPETVSPEFDWEVELGVVIGAAAVDVEPQDAWRHVAGYCVVNDITARDLQRRHQQWHLGKNVPGSTPIGPWVVARDAVGVPPDLHVTLRVNGVEKQSAWTSHLIHDIPTLIALLSHTTTLQPGDVIATGTPAGVGFARVPAEFLRDGDIVQTEVDGVGVLTNVIRTASVGAVREPAAEAVAGG